MQNEQHKTPRTDRTSRRGVFGSRKFWFLSAEWSAVAFAVAAGLVVILWAFMTGRQGAVGGFAERRAPAPPPAARQTQTAAPEVARYPLDGAPYDQKADRQIVAVSMDNIDVARPQAGLAEARLVYEAPVEGGITRFLAFFDAGGTSVGKIGPVRSARPYFLDWIGAYGAAFAHVGGSPEALGDLKTDGLRDLNQFFWGAYFWRDRTRAAPHNVYTSTALLNKALDVVGRTPQTDAVTHGRFGAAGTPAASAPDLVIDYSSPAYRVAWKYDPAKDDYVRYQGGTETIDQDGAVVRAKNVVVQFSGTKVVDADGRLHIDTKGPDDALVARDGHVTKAKWSAKSGTPAAYVDASGGPVFLTPGVTWIEVVPDGKNVTY